MPIPEMSPTAAVRRIVFLSYGGLAASAAALAAARLTSVSGRTAATLACGALLLAAGAAVWHFGRRLRGVLRVAEETAAQAHSELQAALDNMSQGLVLCDTAANIVAVNDRFMQLFGIPAHRARRGMAVAELIRLQAEAGNMTSEFAEILIHERLNRPPGASGRLLMPFRLGQLEVADQPRPEGGWACTFEDVTAQKNADQRLAFLAHHDSLTKLPNRALLRERIDAAIKAGPDFALMLVDLDHFKLANDTFGHAVGDALLSAASDRMRARMREGDTVARLGGDEFAVLMSSPCTREEADRRAGGLVRALADPFHMEGRQLKIGGSVGVSFVTNTKDISDTLNTDMLLHQADTALYRAKQEGRRTHCFFEGKTEHEVVVSRTEEDQIATLLTTASILPS
jgi:diguanylate cyclase (GGDEF)-like protein